MRTVLSSLQVEHGSRLNSAIDAFGIFGSTLRNDRMNSATSGYSLRLKVVIYLIPILFYQQAIALDFAFDHLQFYLPKSTNVL